MVPCLRIGQHKNDDRTWAPLSSQQDCSVIWRAKMWVVLLYSDHTLLLSDNIVWRAYLLLRTRDRMTTVLSSLEVVDGCHSHGVTQVGLGDRSFSCIQRSFR